MRYSVHQLAGLIDLLVEAGLREYTEELKAAERERLLAESQSDSPESTD